MNKLADEVLQKLLVNLEAGKEREAALNALRQEFEAPADLVTNALPAFIKKKMMEDEEEEEEMEENKATKNKKHRMAANQSADKPQTAEQWFASAPQEIQSAVRNAMEIERRERLGLVERLTVNLQGEAKASLSKRLTAKPLDELRDLALLIPSTIQNSQGYAPLPSWLGAAGGAPTVNTDLEGSDDILPLPTMNFSNERKLQKQAN